MRESCIKHSHWGPQENSDHYLKSQDKGDYREGEERGE